MASIFMTEISSWYIHGLKSNVIRALDVNRRANRIRLGVRLDCPKYGYIFRTTDGIIAPAEPDNLKIVQQKNLMATHDKVNVATTPKGASSTRSLRFARSGEQRGVGDIDQSNAVRDNHAAGWFNERWSASTVARTASRSDRLQSLFVRFMMHFSDIFWRDRMEVAGFWRGETLKDPLEMLVTPFETERRDCSAYVSPNDARQDA
jgi:hypothetical protein